MARESPLALRRTPRRRQQHEVEESPRAPGPASQRKSSRSNAARKSATKTTPRTVGSKTAKSKARVSESAAASSAAETDNTADDSITLVDETDDSITALDFDIPIASRASAPGRNTSTGISKRKRRSSITSSSPSGGKPAIKKVRRQTANNDSNTSIVHVVPIRTQILDDHIKRRIRRNGLSEEMNEAYSEKRVRRNRTLAELRRARDDLRSRDAEIERLRELTAVFGGVGHDDNDNDNAEDASRVQDLEQELARLREEVMGRQHGDVLPPSSSPPARGDDYEDWGVPGDMSDHDSDAGGGDFTHDYDDEFGDSSVAELQSGGTPEHHHQKLPGRRPTALHLHGPALTPPSTSPAKLPSSPLRQIHSSGSTVATRNSGCDAGVQVAAMTADAASQACISDPGMDALQDELSTLRSEMASLNDTLQERDSLQARMAEKLVQRQPSSSSSTINDHTDEEDQDVELQLNIVLQDLGEKTSRLAALSSLLISPHTDSTTTDDKEMTAQLTSTVHSIRQALEDLNPDTALPPSTIDTLALAATRLRELDTALAQRTAELEASRAAEAALRSQLAGSDARAAALAQDASQLGQTVAALRDEVAILKEELDGARDDAALQRDAAVAEAEARLRDALARLALIEEARRAGEREAGALRGEVGRLGGLLEEARATAVRLREGGVREREAAREAVGTMRMELLRALQVGEGFLAGDGGRGVAKMEEGVAAAVVPVVQADKTARGRSDDSGLGLLEEGGE